MEQNNNQEEVAKGPNLYYDCGGFKGFSFQKNIEVINKLYFGQGLQISELPFVFKNEQDEKYYLSAYRFKIQFLNEMNEKEIYYPENFLNLVFYYNNLIFFLFPNNEISVFELNEKTCIYYGLTPRFESKKGSQKNVLSDQIKGQNLNLSEDQIKEVFNKLKRIGENTSLKLNYEILCDVLKKKSRSNIK